RAQVWKQENRHDQPCRQDIDHGRDVESEHVRALQIEKDGEPESDAQDDDAESDHGLCISITSLNQALCCSMCTTELAVGGRRFRFAVTFSIWANIAFAIHNQEIPIT